MRKFAAVALVLVVGVSVAMAEEFGGSLKKVEGDKITIQKRGEKKGEKGPEVTLTVAASAKIVKGKFNKEAKKLEAGESLEGGLKNAAVKAGAIVRVTTDASNNVTELIVGPAFGDFKKKKRDN